MCIDAWNPTTFSADVVAVLREHSALIADFHRDEKRLMDEHRNSDPYESLKSSQHYPAYTRFVEQVLTPIVAESHVRVWHYTRLMDDEADAMQEQLSLSSLDYLRRRLNNLVSRCFLTKADAETVFAQSPLHRDGKNRAGQFCTTDIPLSPGDSGVERLLENWGGESAYFWLSDKRIAAILKRLGKPRIVEIETGLSDKFNGDHVAKTMVSAWARRLGIPVSLSGSDLFISGCIGTAKVIRIHTEGDGLFDAVATSYPDGAEAFLK